MLKKKKVTLHCFTPILVKLIEASVSKLIFNLTVP